MQPMQWLQEAIKIHFPPLAFLRSHTLRPYVHVSCHSVFFKRTDKIGWGDKNKAQKRPMKGLIREENAVQRTTLWFLVTAYFRSGRVKRKLSSFLTAIQEITAYSNHLIISSRAHWGRCISTPAGAWESCNFYKCRHFPIRPATLWIKWSFCRVWSVSVN